MRVVAVATVALSLLAAAQPAWCSSFKEADAYFYVRDKAQVLDKFSMDDVQTRPQDFAGKEVEVRGQVRAIAGADDHVTLLIDGGNTGSTLMVTLPPGKKAADWPFLDVGISVRLLCQVVTVQGNASGSLELVIPVKEYEAAQIDAARDKEKARIEALKARQNPAPQKASRGVGAAAYPARGAQRTYQNSQQRLSENQILDAYANAVRYFNKRVSPADSRKIASAIIHNSREKGLDARLVMAVIACESNFNPNAVSRCGAMGLGQLMPGTANDLGVGNAFDYQQNLSGSTALLSAHIHNFKANGEPTEEAVKLALACYNAGAGAVKKYKGIPPYRETRDYVKKITRLYNQFCGVKS